VDFMVAQGVFGTDFYEGAILRPMHRAYYHSGRTIIKIGPKGTLGSHEIRPIHSSPSLGQSIEYRDEVTLTYARSPSQPPAPFLDQHDFNFPTTLIY